MKVFLSCVKTNRLFIDAATEAMENLNRAIVPGTIQPINPPENWGIKGDIVTKTLQIMDVSLVLIDMTPNVYSLGDPPVKIVEFNPDVMIEYGIVFGLNKLRVPGLGIGVAL